MNFLFTIVKRLFDLCFPHICHICYYRLQSGERLVCTECVGKIRKTLYIDIHDNVLARQYWGIFPIEAALASFQYVPGNTLSIIVHRMKYNSEEDLCRLMGEFVACDTRAAALIHAGDVLVPVPLTKKKERLRGYNQSLRICEGICRVIEKEINTSVLVRRHYADSQTKKTATARRENVRGVFCLSDSTPLQGKHIILVDDIITTTSTTRECLYALKDIPGVRISILALGRAI